MAKSNLTTVLEALDAGLSLSVWDDQGRERQFVQGQITRQINTRGSIRTTHLNGNLHGYVWLTKTGIALLAKQAKDKLARKGEILAEQERRTKVAMGRD